MEDTYDSWNGHLIVVENIMATNEFNTGCPIRNPDFDSGGAAGGNVVQLNSMFFVDLAYAAPFDSFSNFITAYPAALCYVIDRNTGELRYYDGAQAGNSLLFWTPMQRAIGTINETNITNKRTLEAIYEHGQKFARDIKAHLHEVPVEFTKVLIDKQKITPSRLSAVWEQFNFAGTGLVEGDTLLDLINPEPQAWYMCILYVYDSSGDAANVGRSYIMPCCKFEEYRIRSRNKETLMIDIRGLATYAYTIPRDKDNVPDYTPVVNAGP